MNLIQLTAAVTSVLLVSLVQADTSCSQIKIDCLPGNQSPTESQCKEKSCCWEEKPSDSSAPKCSYPSGYVTYVVKSLHPHARGVDALLQKRGTSSTFPDDIQSLALSIQFINKNILRIKITDSEKERFEPPLPKINLDPLTKPDEQTDYKVSVHPQTASIQITRRSTNEVIFDSSVGGFIFANQFIQISTLIPTKNLYGLGEHHEDFNRGLKANTLTIFNRGEIVPAEKSGFNLYGSHPFYVSIEKSGNVHGVFLHNSNAMDVVVQPSNPSVTFRTIGGVLDFYFFMGPSGDEVIQQYTALIGRPFFVPYWTLGFHLCRYGYNTTTETRDTWKNNKNAGIPLDTMWSDIDYMDHMKDFTFDKTRMGDLKSFIQEMHTANVHYIMNNSPGLSGLEASGTYEPLDTAKKLNLFIKDYKGDILEALVWQNITYMLDFSNPNITDFWEQNFRNFHNEISFDGAWIDMNEPYSFHWGSLKGCPVDNPLDHPPYVPGVQDLFNGTICMSAQQHLSTHYNVHTLYAIMETIATNNAVTKILNKRPFILSRASSPGFGFYGAHWSGDIHSSWEHLRYSISNMINFNMYGISMIGSDICGFVSNTNEELCTRWMQLGAFYPFSRNHNDFDTIPQDPASFKGQTLDIMRASVVGRYSLLPFFYTHMYHSHVDGTPAVRPLFFDFPQDQQTYNIEEQFMWGKSLMVIPVVHENCTNVTGYLPSALWYDYYTGEKHDSKGESVTLPAPIDKINVLIKEGSVIPKQEQGLTTFESRANPFNLLVTLDKNGEASGELYWDDGDSLDSIKAVKYNYIQFQVKKNTLNATVSQKGYGTSMVLNKVEVYGATPDIKNATVNKKVATVSNNDGILGITFGDISLLEEITIVWTK